MKLFGKRAAAPARASSEFSPEEYDPVLRCSICTGEQVACMREKKSGKLSEIMLIRTPADLEKFCADYQVKPEQISKVY